MIVLFFSTISAVLFSEGIIFSFHSKLASASAATKFERNEHAKAHS
jgi:hypothetical protein